MACMILTEEQRKALEDLLEVALSTACMPSVDAEECICYADPTIDISAGCPYNRVRELFGLDDND